MAERIARARNMIPLSSWLAERKRSDRSLRDTLDADEAVENFRSDSPGAAHSTLVDDAYARGRADGTAISAAECEELRRRDNEDYKRREQELTERWTERCAKDVAVEIRNAFDQLRLQLERSLHGSLMPFIDDAVRVRAVDELFDLIRNDLAERSEAPIEIRAPLALHNRLQMELVAAGLHTVLTEDDCVEIISRADAINFDGFASRWITTLRSECHER